MSTEIHLLIIVEATSKHTNLSEWKTLINGSKNCGRYESSPNTGDQYANELTTLNKEAQKNIN